MKTDTHTESNLTTTPPSAQGPKPPYDRILLALTSMPIICASCANSTGFHTHARKRKQAIVAVDLWRWQSGRVTPEQLGWQMVMN